eukprot:GHRR01036680.1.p2 GENE.GHRR01036680.1~~GHRR01036680.1.p2  ORF type:complete len:113 (+),score=16.49 GHRR01036680.1:149-487(+)
MQLTPAHGGTALVPTLSANNTRPDSLLPHLVETLCYLLHRMQVGSILSNSSDLSFPISTDSAQTWLLTTYQDEDTRITRGDGGSVFILTKDVPYSPSSMTSQQEAVAEAMML